MVPGFMINKFNKKKIRERRGDCCNIFFTTKNTLSIILLNTITNKKS